MHKHKLQRITRCESINFNQVDGAFFSALGNKKEKKGQIRSVHRSTPDREIQGHGLTGACRATF